jgi:hypothetical protein
MMLEAGLWLGKGTMLSEGRSLGRALACEVKVERDASGIDLKGHWTLEGESPCEFTIRIAQNEVGTYTLGAYSAGMNLHGTAKLDSPPNMGLLWNEVGNVHLAVALFGISGGYGCRGFARDGEHVHTWEVAFRLKQEVVRGPNVVSLHRPRGR